MEIEEDNNYLFEVEKLMSSDVISTYWSHNMDLLVIVTTDNLLELYRINFKAQRVFQIQEDKLITSVSFSPDSQFIAYGMNDGQTIVLKTQNGQKRLSVIDHINQQIKSFNFVEYGDYPVQKVFPFKKNPILQKLLLPISPHKNCNKSSIVKINYFNQLCSQSPFTLLLSSSQKHSCLHINGFITCAQINYDMVALKHFSQSSTYTVHYSNFSRQKRLQSFLVQGLSDRYVIYHVQFVSTILKDMQSQVIKFNSLISYVSQIVTFVESAFPAAELFLRDILRQYNSKMNLIDDPQQQNVNPCLQLFKFLNCGITSTALINFLTKQVYDTKVLQKLDETLNSTFNNLHQLLLQSIQNSLERAYLLVQQLKNICSLEKYKIFEVKQSDLNQIASQIQKLYTMGQVLLVQSTQAKFDIRNLLVWLNKATIKTATDPNAQIQNAKSYLSRYTVDFNRLHKFLETQQKFKLQNLIGFFSKANQSQSMHIPQCQFRLLKDINKFNPKFQPQYIRKTLELQETLGLQNIHFDPKSRKMDIQLTYRSFKLQMKQLKDDWKVIKARPIIQISKKIEQSYSIHKVGEVFASEIYDFQLKWSHKKNELKKESQLLMYFVQSTSKRSLQSNSKLIEYSAISHSHRYLTIPSIYQTLSLSIGIDIILLLQNNSKMDQQKIIAQISNQQWNGQHIQIGRKIQKLNGQVIVNAGMRGLNCFVLNKNKLVVFD